MDVDLQLFKNIMKESRNNSDLLDSYSPNQFKSKEILINHIKNLNILNSNSEITILGGWYGSILIPSFKSIKRITLIDIDKNIISIAKNRLFNHYKNVDFITSDVFHKNRYGRIMNANLIINTSCEHMKPMKELEPLKNSKSYFAFQSNNMFDIPTHINCVNTIDEFKEQLPNNAKIMIEDYITDDRGTRFLLIGQL
jgi:hypothetical protein